MDNKTMIEVVANDRMGKRVKCLQKDTIYALKQLIGALTGARPKKLILKNVNFVTNFI